MQSRNLQILNILLNLGKQTRTPIFNVMPTKYALCRHCFGTTTQARGNNVEGSTSFSSPPSPDDERSLDEEIPQQEPKVVHELPHRRRSNCAVYGAGLASTGSLAIDKLIENPTAPQTLYKPMRVSRMNYNKIKLVAAGGGFSLFAANDALYGAGLNNFYQLSGPRRINEDEEPHPFTGYSGRNEAEMWYPKSKRIMLPTESGKIMGISAGRMHSVILTDKNLVFCFGSNTHGQCAADPIQHPVFTHNKNHVLNPVRTLPLAEGDQIVQIHACLDTTFALCQNGKLFSWGLGTDGQLGNGNREFQWQPELVQGDVENEKIVHIGGSTDTLLAVNDKGDVFIWGQNEYGQLGPLTDEPQVFLPTFLPFKMGKVLQAEATGSSCIVCNSEGEVHSWGSYVLGFGPKVERLERPMKLDQPLFASAMSDDGSVQKIFAGNCCMAAITEAGHLFSWGANRHGSLALGHRNHQYFPFQVSFGETVKHAAFGPDHSLFVTNRY